MKSIKSFGQEKNTTHNPRVGRVGGLVVSSIFALGLAVAGMTATAGENKDSRSCDGHRAMHHAGAKGAWGQHKLMSKLDLSDAQKQTLKDQRTAQMDANKQMRTQINEAHDALMTAVDSGASDVELQQLAANLGKLEGQAALSRAQAHQTFLAVLTPEQKQKLSEMRDARQEKIKQRMEQRSANKS